MLPWSESSIGKYALVIEIGVTAPMSVGNCPCALGKLPNIVARPLPIRPCHGSLRLYQNRNISKPFVLLNLYSNTISRLNGKSAIRAQSVNTSQVNAQSVTRFSREDEESVRRCLQPLVSALAYSEDPVAQYLYPTKRDFESAYETGIQAQLSEANAADLLFQAADFAAAAWCYKVPEELPLKAASQDPAEMSDSKVNDDAKFEQFKKAVNEQLVDFMLAHGSYIQIVAMGTLPEMQGKGLGGSLLSAICKVADAEQQWVYLETSSERATKLYKRHGFQVVKEVKPQPDAPVTFCMGRPAKPDVPSDV